MGYCYCISTSKPTAFHLFLYGYTRDLSTKRSVGLTLFILLATNSLSICLSWPVLVQTPDSYIPLLSEHIRVAERLGSPCSPPKNPKNIWFPRRSWSFQEIERAHPNGPWTTPWLGTPWAFPLGVARERRAAGDEAWSVLHQEADAGPQKLRARYRWLYWGHQFTNKSGPIHRVFW